MKLDKLFTNARIVSSTGKYDGSIGVKDGKIVMIGMPDTKEEASEIIDCGGKYVLPGFIDGHIHPCDPGTTHREDFPHLTASMAANGTTLGLMMPMNVPVVVDKKTFDETIACYEGRAYVDYGLHGAAVSTNLDTADELWRATGSAAMKMFMCFSTVDAPFVNDDEMYAHLEILAENGGVALIHCENDLILKKVENDLKSEGRKDGMAYNASHPAFAEIEAVGRAIIFLKQTGAAGIIVHVSTAEGLRMIKKAREEEGVKVWAETCPHFLHFVANDMKRLGAALKQSPPMHEEENREELWKLLAKEGYVATVASDHCPFSSEEKFADPDDIWKTPNGIPGVQVIAPVLLDGVNAGRLTIERVVELTSLNASKLYGVYPQKGVLQVGSDADFAVIDMDLEKAFTEEDNLSKCSWSPYFGDTFKGWPVMTVCRGEIVYRDGHIVGKLGYGKYTGRKKQ